METQQTLVNFIKNRKRPTNEDYVSKKGFVDDNVEISKPSRKLSFDDSSEHIVKKQKVSLHCKLYRIIIKYNLRTYLFKCIPVIIYYFITYY